MGDFILSTNGNLWKVSVMEVIGQFTYFKTILADAKQKKLERKARARAGRQRGSYCGHPRKRPRLLGLVAVAGHGQRLVRQ